MTIDAYNMTMCQSVADHTSCEGTYFSYNYPGL